jgi:hypothetical protein
MPEVPWAAEDYRKNFNVMRAAKSLEELDGLPQRDLCDLEDPTTAQFSVYTTESR